MLVWVSFAFCHALCSHSSEFKGFGLWCPLLSLRTSRCGLWCTKVLFQDLNLYCSRVVPFYIYVELDVGFWCSTLTFIIRFPISMHLSLLNNFFTLKKFKIWVCCHLCGTVYTIQCTVGCLCLQRPVLHFSGFPTMLLDILVDIGCIVWSSDNLFLVCEIMLFCYQCINGNTYLSSSKSHFQYSMSELILGWFSL